MFGDWTAKVAAASILGKFALSLGTDSTKQAIRFFWGLNFQFGNRNPLLHLLILARRFDLFYVQNSAEDAISAERVKKFKLPLTLINLSALSVVFEAFHDLKSSGKDAARFKS